MVKRVLLIVIAVILVLGGTVLQSGCGTTDKTITVTTTKTVTNTTITTPTTPAGTGTPQYGGTLRFAHVFGPVSAGWPAHPRFHFGPFMNVFFDTILIQDPQGIVKPCLATEWEVAPDGKALDLTLRQGVKFHDGSDWNADVAKWNIDILLDAKKSTYNTVTSCDKLGEYKIRLNLTEFTNTIYYTLQGTFCASKAAYDKNGEDWMNSHPVGTGPFKFDSWTPNVSIKGVRFDDYWGGRPYLDAVEMNQIVDIPTMAASFENKENDIFGYDLDKQAYDLQQKGYQVYSDYISIYLLLPDGANADSPYADIRVRQAVNCAIDRDAIVDTLGYGFWGAVDQYAIPGSVNYIEGLPTNPYDPEKAKQLLADAGYPNGFTSSIMGDAFVSSKDAVTAIQGYLSKVGITADVTMADAPTIQETLSKGWYNTVLGLPRGGAACNWSGGFTQFSKNDTNNISVPKTDEYQQLYEDSISSLQYDPTLVKKVVQYIYDNTLFVPIYAASTGYVVQPYVHDPGFFNLGYFWYWTPAKTWLSN